MFIVYLVATLFVGLICVAANALLGGVIGGLIVTVDAALAGRVNDGLIDSAISGAIFGVTCGAISGAIIIIGGIGLAITGAIEETNNVIDIVFSVLVCRLHDRHMTA